MDTNIQLRNLKDFLQLYNSMTETCFGRCVDDMTIRHLNKEEESCIDYCSGKFIHTNHKIMALYVNAQTDIVNKRVEEANALQQQQQQVKQPEQPT